MLVTHAERPRELKWYHAGPLLYGDLGTSRFYVLGLAFYYSLFASPWYVLGVCCLVAAVGWAYTVICRCYPDGGGVYSAARQISSTLSVVGALLLFADYAVTAALSSFEGLRYFGVVSHHWVALGAGSAIIVLGIVNYIGPRHAGSLALLIASATLVLTLMLAVLAVPHLPEGWTKMTAPSGTLSQRWFTLVDVVLALSGVEAVANMTGVMVKPVEKTSRRAIWPVLIEVIVFNLLFAVAMLAITPSDAVKSNGDRDFARPARHYDLEVDKIEAELAHARQRAKAEPLYGATVQGLEAKLANAPRISTHERNVKDAVLRVMGEQFATNLFGPQVGKAFGIVAGVVFGLLLLSAVNTVIGGMISVQYVMSRDRELPAVFGRLNMFGVPWVGLLLAVSIPLVLLAIFRELEDLADLYAIGVVGAIAINLTSCTINHKLPIRRWERGALALLAVIMLAIELTLAFQKLHALIFVLIILGAGLGMRFFTRSLPTIKEKIRARWSGLPAPGPAVAAPAPAVSLTGTPAEQLDMTRAHVMVATRGGPRLIDFAANYAKQTNAILFVLFVRQVNVVLGGPSKAPSIEEDVEARRVFEAAVSGCQKAGVPMVPIYAVSSDVAYTILDFAATYSVSALLMGVSRQAALLRAIRGDVLSTVADNLPEDIPLLIHA